MRGYRRASTLTQQQLADMLGYDRTYISMIESGRRSVAFGTSVIRLAGIARHSGRAAEAVSELWPLITWLEARAAAGYAARVPVGGGTHHDPFGMSRDYCGGMTERAGYPDAQAVRIRRFVQ